MRYRTATKQVKALGTAKHGFSHWWMQRLSSVLMLPLGLWFIISLMTMEHISADAIIVWLHHPVQALLMAIWAMTVVYHATLGLQVIIEDYVHSSSMAVTLLTLIKFAMFIMIVAILFSLTKLAS